MRMQLSPNLKMALITAVLIGIHTAGLSPSFGFSINLDPPSIHVSVRPGESATRVLTLTNTGKDPLILHAYTEDWAYAPDGSKRFQAPGTLPRSCANAIVLTPKELTLKPDESGTIQMTVTLPKDAHGGVQAVAFFEALLGSVEKGPGASQVLFAGRLGTLVFVETEGSVQRHGAITSVSLSAPTAARPLEAQFTFGNDGDTHVFADGVVSILNAKGEYIGREKIGRFGILPGTSMTRTATWAGDMIPGTYSVILTLDYGGQDPAVAESRVTVNRK